MRLDHRVTELVGVILLIWIIVLIGWSAGAGVGAFMGWIVGWW